MTELKTLGERLSYAMKERGIGQRDLAIHSGISQANTSKICTEKSKKTTFIVCKSRLITPKISVINQSDLP